MKRIRRNVCRLITGPPPVLRDADAEVEAARVARRQALDDLDAEMVKLIVRAAQYGAFPNREYLSAKDRK